MKKILGLVLLAGILGGCKGWARSEQLVTNDDSDVYIVVCTKDQKLCEDDATNVCAKKYTPAKIAMPIGSDYFRNRDMYFFEYICLGGDDL